MTLTEFPTFYDFMITEKSDSLSVDAHLYFDQQSQVLRELNSIINSVVVTLVSKGSVTINGLTPPSKTSDEINALISDTNNPIPVGTMWYNSTSKKLNYLKEYTSPGVGVISEINSTP